jgi:hypothetical protein
MIQNVVDHPWIFFAFVATIVLLNLAASMRIRRDQKLKTRANVNRRKNQRAGKDRRWKARK